MSKSPAPRNSTYTHIEVYRDDEDGHLYFALMDGDERLGQLTAHEPSDPQVAEFLQIMFGSEPVARQIDLH